MEKIFINTLLYSIGSGLVLALLTGLTLFLTRNAAPVLRYRLLVLFLGLFAISTAAIVIGQISFTASPDETGLVTTVISQYSAEVSAAPAAGRGIISIVTGFLNNHSGTILLLWLMIVFVKSVMLASNLLELHHLKTKKVYPAGAFWEERVSRLSEQMGLNRTVHVIQSGIVQMPVVIGHFKPVILVPLGMITAIKPEQIEMMLLHELAHIKRMDFVVNFLQHVLELLFFFNPAVLWTSALIRRERESCCDDLVLQNAPSKYNYIQALLSFKEYQSKVPSYALAFAKESTLVSRVKRIVYQKNASLNSLEKTLLLCTVVLLCSFSMLGNTTMTKKESRTFQQEPEAKAKASTSPAAKKSRVVKKGEIKADEKRTEVFAVDKLVRGIVNPIVNISTDLSANIADMVVSLVDPVVKIDSSLSYTSGINISSAGVLQDTIKKPKPNVQPKSPRLNTAPKPAGTLKTASPAGNPVMRIRGSNSLSSANDLLFIVDGVVAPVNPLSGLNPEDISAMEVLKDATGMSIYGARAANGVVFVTTKQGTLEKQAVDNKRSLNQKHLYPLTPDQKMYVYEQATKPVTELNTNNNVNVGSAISAEPKVAAKPAGLTEQLIAALQKAGIDTKGDEFRFKITNTELTLNGVKQPDHVHKQVISDFLKSPEDKIEFSYDRKGRSVSSSSSYSTK